MAKQIIFSDKAREELVKGSETLCQTVAVTLGPASGPEDYDGDF